MSESLVAHRAHRDFPGIPDTTNTQKQQEAAKEAEGYLKLSKENPHALAQAIKRNPKREPLLRNILWDNEYERIRDLNPAMLSENAEIASLQKKIYDFVDINPDTDRNPAKEKFIKGLVDSIIVDNAEVALLIIETNWALLKEMMAQVFSWEGLKQMAEALGKNVMELFSGDAYKTGKSLWELWLVTTGSGAGGFLLKKAWKAAVKSWEKMIARSGKETVVSQGLQAGWRITEQVGKVVQAPYNVAEAWVKKVASAAWTGIRRTAEAVGNIPSVRKAVEPVWKAISEGREMLSEWAQKVISATKERAKEVLALASAPILVWSKDGAERTLQKQIGSIGDRGEKPELKLHPRFSEAQLAVRGTLAEFPEIASVVEKYLLDEKHSTNLRNFLRNPETRKAVLLNIREIASSQKIDSSEFLALAERSLWSKSKLMRQADEVFSTVNWERKSSILSKELKEKDPELFSIGENPTVRQLMLLERYVNELRTNGQESLRSALESIAWKKAGGFPEINVRAKSAEGVLDKISRMRKWNGGKEPRPDYDLSQMPDILGWRITVKDIEDLEKTMLAIEAHFGKAKIIERDNFYSNPAKAQKPYRAITYTVQVLIEGYPAEIQLTTLKASIAADLDHNVLYKPLVRASEQEKEAVKSFCRQATAIELQAL